MAKGQILIADDDPAIRTVLVKALERAGYDIRATGNASTLWKWISRGDGQLVVTDVVMPDENIFDLLPQIKRLRPNLPIVVMSAQNTLMTAITAAERGAYEYLPKPFDLNELIAVVGRGLAERQTDQKAPPAKPPEENGPPVIGRSPAMQEIYRILARLTQTDLTVMISGESGTGKELIAKALHDFGKRASGPFVAINMAAIPKDLIESELFGHEKGAFTGATSRKTGRFEQAEGGSLFLDEIGDMPMDAQTRLLRVLQEGEYTTVGGRRAIATDVRVIAATHRDLTQLINQGAFREDLFYRLNVVPMRLPPLRERLEDIPDLAFHFLRLASKEGASETDDIASETRFKHDDRRTAPKTLDSSALERLQAYHWPGNIRELENLIRRIVVLYPQDNIMSDVIDIELETNRSPVGMPAATDMDIDESVEHNLKLYFAQFGEEMPPAGLYHRVLRKIEYPLITATLAATGGNQVKAAEVLGLNRNTLRKKIQELDIKIIKTTI